MEEYETDFPDLALSVARFEHTDNGILVGFLGLFESTEQELYKEVLVSTDKSEGKCDEEVENIAWALLENDFVDWLEEVTGEQDEDDEDEDNYTDDEHEDSV